eukprot:4276621-Amphidinium_carterae.1
MISSDLPNNGLPSCKLRPWRTSLLQQKQRKLESSAETGKNQTRSKMILCQRDCRPALKPMSSLRGAELPWTILLPAFESAFRLLFSRGQNH